MNHNPRRRITVFLIAPSKYDDNGFVQRYLKGVITTTSLSTVAQLTEQALGNIVSPRDKTTVKTFEDSIFYQSLTIVWYYWFWRLRCLWYRCCHIKTELIVGLVGVQSHQFPRTCDLAHRWLSRHAVCIIGGSHVTGAISAMLDGLGDRGEGQIPCPHQMPPEIQAIQSAGVIIFHGEAEPHPDGTDAWQEALHDIIEDQPKALYRGGRPDITNTPLPVLTGSAIKYFSRRLVPVNEARGCPFRCKFCSVITMQGQTMRCRRPDIVLDYFRMLCEQYGRARVFITGDNFARNKYRRAILSGLADLRRQGHQITFMIQADVDACLKDNTLIPQLAAAGCNMIFFGVESLNQLNLITAGKKHNLGRDLPTLWQSCHQHNIIVHAAYMIGFPYDTEESVANDVDQLISFGADHVSFYIRGPIPGSEDWIRLICCGHDYDLDMNKYDSFHCVTNHDLLMSRQQCEATFQSAWRRFYRVTHMIRSRQRFTDQTTRWGLLLVHIWYWWAIRVERTHPMIAGFYRFRSYLDRRPEASYLPIWRYLAQEIWRHLRYIGYGLAAFYVFQQIELETEYKLAAKKDAITGHLRSGGDWLYRTFGPGMSRRWLNDFWLRYARNRWRLLNPFVGIWWHIKMIPFAITEIVYTVRFALRLRQIIKVVRT